MEEKKTANGEQIRPRGAVELDECALAAAYPQTHSGVTALRKRRKDQKLALIAAHPLLSRLGHDQLPPKDLPETSGEAGAVAPPADRLLRRASERRDQPSPKEPTPCKKPWAK